MQTEQPVDKSHLKGSFAELKFVNTAVNSLPIEENPQNQTHQVVGHNYSRVQPEPRENPRIVSLSAPALALLDLDKDRVEKDPDTPAYLSGNKPIPGSDPIAHCYCGHQFGSFAGQLGDGRAITLGDIKNHKGELWELQFKGSGLTPYSRFADGKAVLRSSIREYLCSEAMWALGIPTTRAASLILTDTLADRDPLYNGNNIKEKCAIVLRLAPTFWRFGSFEIFKDVDALSGRKGPSKGLEEKMMVPMLDYLLKNFFPEQASLEVECGISRTDCYLEMYYEIARRTAYLMALWQCYGFCHGVMNTDNLSVLGLTIDYGPFGWVDYFDKGFICNHSDDSGRYSYENQPEVGKWNLIKLAEVLKSHLSFDQMKSFINLEYDKIYKKHYYDKMREKLGLYCVESEHDKQLIDDLFEVMQANASDFTNTFRKLSSVKIPKNNGKSEISKELITEFADLSPSKDIIAARYKPHYNETQLQRIKDLAQGNMQLLMIMGISPSLVEQEEEKIKKHKEIMAVDDEQNKKEIEARWEAWLKKYENRLVLEKSVLKGEQDGEESKEKEVIVKTKFDTFEELQEQRIRRMNKTNPLYVLRNYMAEEAIQRAENDDFTGVNNLLDLLMNPFEAKEDNYEATQYKKCPPKWAAEICVSCSS